MSDASMEIGHDVDLNLKDPNLYSSDKSEIHGSKGEEDSKRKAPDVEVAELLKKQKVEGHQLQISRVTEKEVHVGNDEDINSVEDDNSTVQRPSRKEALKAVMTLINYFSHHEKTLPEVLTMIRKVQDEIQDSNGNDSKDSRDAAIRDNFREHVSGSKGKESKFNLQTRIDEFLRKRKDVPRPEGCVVGCCICGGWGHSNMNCPFLEYFPKGTEIHPCWETMCKGCDRIGSICCDKGGYAKMKFCPYCCEYGHWVWEDIDVCFKPKDEVFEKPQNLRDMYGDAAD